MLDVLLYVAAYLNNSGASEYLEGRFADADKNYQMALQMAGDSTIHGARILANIAALAQRRNRFSEAEVAYRKVYFVRRTLLGECHTDSVIALNNIAGALRMQGNYSDARRLYLQALKSTIEESADHAIILNNLGDVLRALGNFAEAERYLRYSLTIGMHLYGKEHPQVKIAQNNLAEVLEDAGELQAAANLLERLASDPVSAANLARVRMKQGRLEEAAAMLEGLKLEPGSLLEAAALHTNAIVARQRGELQTARTNFAASLAIRERLLPAEHPVIAPLLLDYAQLLRKMKMGKEAEVLEKRVRKSATTSPTIQTIEWKRLLKN